VDVSDSTSTTLTETANAARSAVDEAKQRGESDPLGTFSRLVDVDRDLDEALAAAGHEADAAGRARAARKAALTRARGAVREADTFISSRSYVIGQTARTRLAAAKDALASAEATAGPAAFPTADRALSLAREALRLAQSDANRPQYPGGGYGGGRRGGYTRRTRRRTDPGHAPRWRSGRRLRWRNGRWFRRRRLRRRRHGRRLRRRRLRWRRRRRAVLRRRPPGIPGRAASLCSHDPSAQGPHRGG